MAGLTGSRAGALPPGRSTLDWMEMRREMVEFQLRKRGISDESVLAAMQWIPREEFVPREAAGASYGDDPLPIGYGQTISQPYMTALMAQCLELTGVEKVLDVGAGSGYHAAVLGRLAARVVSIEIIPELAELAQRNLDRAGCGENVRVVCGDGSAGYEPEAPYAAITVAAAAPAVPDVLLEQLKEPGRLVIPVGSMEDQHLLVLERCRGAVTRRFVTGCRFVPLRGGYGWR